MTDTKLLLIPESNMTDTKLLLIPESNMTDTKLLLIPESDVTDTADTDTNGLVCCDVLDSGTMQ